MPPKKKVQAGSKKGAADDDNKNQQTATDDAPQTRRSGRLATRSQAKEETKVDEPRGRSTKAKDKKKADASPEDDTETKGTKKKVKNGDSKKDIEEEKQESKKKKNSVTKGAQKTADDDDDNDDKNEQKEPVKMIKAIAKGGVAVDHLCHSKNVHVYSGAPGNKIYAATLNQSNVKANNNKVLQSDSDSNKFWVFNRWGRVGADGQQSTKGPFALQAAVSEYESKIYDKTMKGDYIKLDISYANDETEDIQERLDKDAEKSNLPLQVKQLVQLIFDMTMMNKTMKEIGYDAKKMPLGKLAKSTIEKGFEVLKRIAAAVQNKKSKSYLQDLSSEFYSLIPHDVGFKQMSTMVLTDNDDVKKKLDMLTSLQEMQITTKILEEAKGDDNVLDNNYEKLRCEVQSLDKKSEKYKLLCKYVENGHAATHKSWHLEVEEIFELTREDDDKRFKKDIGNRMLLWHGSRLTNYVGIISQGLRIAPPEAPVTGYMFGKGVYFADMVTKSAQYCWTSRENNTGLMLLCDVALGDPNELYYSNYYANELPTGKYSTKGCGKNAPPESTYTKIDDDITLPLGPSTTTNIQQGALLYNEYIVYDVTQIRMKYLFKMKFNYASKTF